MTRLEALALAIAHEYQFLRPGSEATSTLNPGLLRSHSLDRIVPVNENGTRIFSSAQGGFRALAENLRAKCEGRTNAKGVDGGKLTSDSTLSDLVKTFRLCATVNITDYLRSALDDRAITETTPLIFFLQD